MKQYLLYFIFHVNSYCSIILLDVSDGYDTCKNIFVNRNNLYLSYFNPLQVVNYPFL